MAYPRDLVRVLAEVLGVPEGTVALHDRNLAEAGYRRSGGRGRSAVQVTATDAANLLLSVVAPSWDGTTARNSVASFETYRALPAWKEDFRFEEGSWEKVEPLKHLPPGHSLQEALVALVSGYTASRFKDARSVIGPTMAEHWDSGFVDVSVSLHSPDPKAVIRISCGLIPGPRPLPPSERKNELQPTEEVLSAELVYQSPLPSSAEELEAFVEEKMKRKDYSDLIQVRTFTDSTLEALARLLNGNAETTDSVRIYGNGR